LIGLDGATFTILDPLMSKGVMPFLKNFLKSGVRANLRSVIPPLTPPAWTSLVTGRSPGHHGIFDFFLRENNSPHIRFATSKDVRCETIWSIASQNGRRVTTLNFPLMLPPPELNGYVVAGGWMTPRQLPLGCYPDTLYPKIKSIPGFDPHSVAMKMAHEEKVLEGCTRDEYEDWIKMHITREHQWFNILSYLIHEEPCDLTAILFDGVDKIQHLCWRFLAPEYANEVLMPWEQQVQNLCLEYFSKLDRLLAEIVSLSGPDPTIVIASDHGFGAQTETFFVNAWLNREGYLTWANSNYPHESETAVLGIGQMARHVHMLDWEKTTAYAATPSSNGIHVVRPFKESEHSATEGEYIEFRKRLMDSLYTVTNPATGTRTVERIWTREEVFDGPYAHCAPDLTLSLRDGGLISILGSDSPVKLRDKPSGTHRPLGVFMAKGPGIQQGVTAAELSILDVAPILLYSLCLPIPHEMEGSVAEEIFYPSFMKGYPVHFGEYPRSENFSRQDTEDKLLFDAEAEAEMAARLRALGYIE
jgi:predicted AlkP superfamily phosphohydrolase/phosphomutase